DGQQHRERDNPSRCSDGQQGDPMQQRLSSAPFLYVERKTSVTLFNLAGMRPRSARRTVVSACRRRWSCCRTQLLCCSSTSGTVKRASNVGTRCIAARRSGFGRIGRKG